MQSFGGVCGCTSDSGALAGLLKRVRDYLLRLMMNMIRKFNRIREI